MLRRQRGSFTWPILLGALVPDAAIFVFYGWAKWGANLPESVIWSAAYYSQPWQDIFAVGNSIPLALLGLGIALGLKQLGWLTFCASILLHHLCDLPVHHDDAHRHFFPLSDYRFISPLSYWDADHYGHIVALVELTLVILASVSLCRTIESRLGRALLILWSTVALIAYLLFYLG